ncbi:MAG TPA: nucleotide sugar dehydrogenase [Candidatus Limnocylindria bacterium]|nr:nucleotide sugar dehydrogenase [Candidatus Limnocylindria bacterium]
MKIAVVGLGHIGLPLAVQYAGRGHEVIGCDLDSRVVEAINRGESPHDDEPAVSELVPGLVRDGHLRATTDDAAGVREAEVVVVIVPVVVDEARQVDFSQIDAATTEVARGLQPGTLVIYETTLPIGTTRDRLGPMLEAGSGLRAGSDFDLAFSPERVLVGRVLLDLRRYPKIVGGTTEQATRRAVEFYGAVLDPGTEIRALASAEAAEMTKLAETTYRDVNIALANEFAQVADRRGIDVTEIISAANSQPYSHIHQPGVGVGGHCIPVYPHLLFRDEPDLRIPPLARMVNDGMAAYAVGQLGEALGPLEGVPVLVLGIGYRGDVREDFFSSALLLREALVAAGATVYGHDPYFDAEHLLKRGFVPYDLAEPVPVRAAILQADHAAYRELDLAALPGLEVLLDGRNALDPGRATAAGIRYLGVGR